jgi:hypothetical protein
MIKLIDILREAKQIGPLYHFTNISFLDGIIKTGLKFEPNNSTLPQHKNTYSISVTRDKIGAGVIDYLSNLTDFDVRIKLDGDKISERYKVEPINVENVWMAGDKNWKTSSKFPELFEERIISYKPGYLSPSYILQIDTIVPEEDIDDELIDKVNIIDHF